MAGAIYYVLLMSAIVSVSLNIVQVIKTIPFKQLNIEVLSVEFNLLGRFYLLSKSIEKSLYERETKRYVLFRVFPGTRSHLHSFLDDAGYSYIGTLGGEV